MTRYTDAEHTITLTDAEDNIIDLTDCSDFHLTYAQDGVTELEKSGNDVTVQTDGTLLVTLTQEETGRFERGKVMVQLRFKDEGGLARATEWIKLECDEVLKKGVI